MALDSTTLIPVLDTSASASVIGNPYFFTGARLDDETGLYYMRHRYMDPRYGRFISRDPLGVWGDELNLGSSSSYAVCNPWTLVDPLGLYMSFDPNSGAKQSQWDLAGPLSSTPGDMALPQDTGQFDPLMYCPTLPETSPFPMVRLSAKTGACKDKSSAAPPATTPTTGPNRTVGTGKHYWLGPFDSLATRQMEVENEQLRAGDISQEDKTDNDTVRGVVGMVGMAAMYVVAYGPAVIDLVLGVAEESGSDDTDPLPTGEAPDSLGQESGPSTTIQDGQGFSSEKQALVEMAKRDAQTGTTSGDMQAYKELNNQLSDPFPTGQVRGPEVHPLRTPGSPPGHGQTPHGHVGPVNHIPIKD